jgi:hypothetical protein
MEQHPTDLSEALDALTKCMITVLKLAPEAAPVIIQQRWITAAKIAYNERKAEAKAS